MAGHVDITVRLPVINPDESGDAVGRVQVILNTFAELSGEETLLNQTFTNGDETQKRIKKFQRENGIAPDTGGVGVRTWKALLETWLPPIEAG